MTTWLGKKPNDFIDVLAVADWIDSDPDAAVNEFCARTLDKSMGCTGDNDGFESHRTLRQREC